MKRAELLGRLTELVGQRVAPHTVRVAVDGPDAAGKTTLADELACALRAVGRPVLRVGVDDFHHPRRLRHRRGPLSPEGYLHDCFDHEALRRLVLDPLGPAGDGRYVRALMDYESEARRHGPAEPAPPGAVLLVDGVFLLTDALRSSWEVSIYVDVTPEESLRRALVRDVRIFGTPEVVRERYTRRYLPGQRLYRAAARPAETADVVVDNGDPSAPVITRWPAQSS
jgi:uridine kinase